MYIANCVVKKDANIQKVMSILSTRTQELTASTKATTDLRRNVTELTNKLSSQNWSQLRSQSQTKSVIVGSSIVKEISQTNLLNTDVVCVPGGKISDAKAAVCDLLFK
jgi:hypothetical protein